MLGRDGPVRGYSLLPVGVSFLRLNFCRSEIEATEKGGLEQGCYKTEGMTETLKVQASGQPWKLGNMERW